MWRFSLERAIVTRVLGLTGLTLLCRGVWVWVSVWEGGGVVLIGNLKKWVARTKEGVFLRNIIAAPIYNHFTMGPPGSQIREVDLF